MPFICQGVCIGCRPEVEPGRGVRREVSVRELESPTLLPSLLDLWQPWRSWGKTWREPTLPAKAGIPNVGIL
jgi:hypothetical protein